MEVIQKGQLQNWITMVCKINVHYCTHNFRLKQEKEGTMNPLEGNPNKNNCLVSNFYDKLKSPALFSHLLSTEKSAENFNLMQELLTRRCSYFDLSLVYIIFHFFGGFMRIKTKQQDEAFFKLDQRGMTKSSHKFRFFLALAKKFRKRSYFSDFSKGLCSLLWTCVERSLKTTYSTRGDCERP